MKNKNYLKIESKLKYFLFLMAYLLLYIPSFLLYHRKNKWLICERGTDAQDNGYIFYRFMKNNHKDIKVYYLITNTSLDITKIDKKDIVNFAGLKHFMLAIACKVQISSHLFGYAPWTNFMLYLRRHKTRNIHVFLQHGITYNNQFGFYKNVCAALDLYVCGSSFEQKYICEKFGYTDKEAVLTGFARFDNLYNDVEKECLVVMPTWRRYLSKITKEEFVKSAYYKNWHSILKNDLLKEACAKKGIKIVFYLHSSLQSFSDLFEDLNGIKIVKYGQEIVQNLLKKSAILLTDYSSVFFDCLYMNKNIILYQFDKDEFKKEHYEEGYISLLDTNVVLIKTKEQEVLSQVLDFLSSNSEEHQLKIDKFSKDFFLIKDRNNCKRIFNSILEKL